MKSSLSNPEEMHMVVRGLRSHPPRESEQNKSQMGAFSVSIQTVFWISRSARVQSCVCTMVMEAALHEACGLRVRRSKHFGQDGLSLHICSSVFRKNMPIVFRGRGGGGDLRLGHISGEWMTIVCVWGTFQEDEWRGLAFGAHRMCQFG